MAKTLFEEKTLEGFIYNEEFGVHLVSQIGEYPLVVGESYTVEWNDVAYECNAQDASDMIPGCVVLGNASKFEGLSGKEEPFVIASVPEGMLFGVLLDKEEECDSYTVSIYQTKTIILPEYILGFTEYGDAVAENLLIAGKKTIVKWNGIEYTFIAVEASSGGETATAVGNLSLVDAGEDTGEEFCIATLESEGTPMVVFFTSFTETVHTIEIYQVYTKNYSVNDILIRDHLGEQRLYKAVSKVLFTHGNGITKVPYSYGESVDNVPITLDFSNGNQTIVAPDGTLVKSAIILQPDSLTPSNIRKNANIAGVEGEFLGDTEELSVELDFSWGNQEQEVIPSSDDKVMSKVIIIKPENLVPNNIAKDVTIAGISGTHEGGKAVFDLDAYFNKTLSDLYCETATELPSYAFQSHTNLTTALFPECSTMGVSAFRSCTNLSSIYFPKLITIPSNAFYGCISLLEASFPECTNLSYGAFQGAKALSYVSFPKCTVIENAAFTHASALTSVFFPECTEIGGYTFSSATGLVSANFPKCSTIGTSAFYSCISLQNASFPVCTTMSSSAFMKCSCLYNAYFPKLTVVPSQAFSSCVNGMANNVNFNAVTTVSGGGFWNINGWKSLPSTLFPALVSIYYSAFAYNYNISYVYLPKAKLIGSNAFSSCKRLATVSLPACTTISSSAFVQCSALMSLYLFGTTYITLNSLAFRSTPLSTSTLTGSFGSIFVRESMLSSYKTRAGWSYFSNRIVGLTDEEIAAL